MIRITSFLFILLLLIPSTISYADLPSKTDIIGQWTIVKIKPRHRVHGQEKTIAEKYITENTNCVLILSRHDSCTLHTTGANNKITGTWSLEKGSDLVSYTNASTGSYHSKEVETKSLRIEFDDKTPLGDYIEGTIKGLDRKHTKFICENDRYVYFFEKLN